MPQPTRSWREFTVETLIRVAGVSAIVFVALIMLFLIREGVPAVFEAPLSSFSESRWYPTEGHFGLLPLITGSVIVTVGAAVVSIPLGLFSAVYIAEIAPRWLREILKPFIEILAGIPSVVLGFIGILVFVPEIRILFGVPTGLSALTGSFLLAGMALPTIISVAEDALDAVPKSLRDAGLALGATRWQTIWWVVVPAARSGILTAMMLGIGRAIGETMAVMMVTGNAARLPHGLEAFVYPVRTMTATIADEMGEVAQGSVHYHVLFLIGLILFAITFLINLVASIVIFRQARRHQERMLA